MHTSRETLTQNLFENMIAVKRGMAGHLINPDCPIAQSQLELLFAIRHAQPVSFKDLAQQLYLTPGAVSQLAEVLEQRKLIRRQVDERDRRLQSLRVTRQGTALLQTVEKQRRAIMEAVVGELTDHELAVWLRIQQKMLKQFQATATKHHKKETA